MTDDEIVALLEATPLAKLRKEAVLVYHCRRGCALLLVFTIDGRRFAYKRGVKLSEELNLQTTVQAAREKGTRDGNRRWRPYAFPMSLAGGWLLAECTHVRAQVDCETIDADMRSATRQPTLIQVTHGEMR